MTPRRSSDKTDMFECTVWDVQIRVSLWFPASVIVMLSMPDAGITVQCLTASLLHECGHFAVMLLTHDRPSRICCGIFGVRVERDDVCRTGYAAQAAVSLGGPLVNLLCAVLLYAFTGVSDGMLIHMALGMMHLLPVSGLDGGEALYRLLCLRCSEHTAHTVILSVSVAVLLPLAAFGFFLLLRTSRNGSLLLLTGYLILLLIFKEKC